MFIFVAVRMGAMISSAYAASLERNGFFYDRTGKGGKASRES